MLQIWTTRSNICNMPHVEPGPKSLILDLLSTLRTGSMPVSALVRGASLFGIGENRLRVALARLLAAGQVERDERGRYRLGSAALAVNRQVTGWRDLESLRRHWDGDWIALHTASLAGADRSSRTRRARALRFGGFRTLARDLWLRPDNLAGGVSAARERLLDLGVEPGCAIFVARDLGDDLESRAHALWPTDELRAGYRDSLARIEQSRERLSRVPPEQAMVESFLLGGAVIRQLVLDPLLPDEILPADERRTLIAAMRDYDRFGRTCWAPFLREAGVEGRRAPAHLGSDRDLTMTGGSM
jgi:phenylacetic acid degradation operon negative regulatory protein